MGRQFMFVIEFESGKECRADWLLIRGLLGRNEWAAEEFVLVAGRRRRAHGPQRGRGQSLRAAPPSLELGPSGAKSSGRASDTSEEESEG